VSSDSRLRSYKRVLDACPCVYHLERLDAERRRQGDGPWLPIHVPQSDILPYWYWRCGLIFTQSAFPMLTFDPVEDPNRIHSLWSRSIPDPD
jgi:hypothetical protein